MIKGNVIRLGSEKTIEVVPLDASRLFISTASVAFLNIERDEEYNVSAVSFEDKETISIGDNFMVKIGNVNSLYQIKTIIVEKNQQSVILFSSHPTKATIFVLPLLGKSKLHLKTDSYFVNCFIDSTHNYICLLYRFTGTSSYKQFEETLMKDKTFVKHVEYDPYHVMYVFRVPENLKNDIKNFVNGKYSKFSTYARMLILRFYGNKECHALQIVEKHPKLKEMIEKDLYMKLDQDTELASKPILKNEIFTLPE